MCLSAPRHKFSGNPSAISLDAPQRLAILDRCLSLRPHKRLLADYLRVLDGLTSTRLIKVRSGILISIRTISAMSSL